MAIVARRRGRPRRSRSSCWPPAPTRASSPATGRRSSRRAAAPASGRSRPVLPLLGHAPRPRHRLRRARLGPGLPEHVALRPPLRRARTGRLRHRLPIEVAWRGDVERRSPGSPVITYVGEATFASIPTVRPASRTATALPPHYGTPAVAFVPIPAGRHALRIDVPLRRRLTWGGPPPVGPWATFRIERGRGPGGREPGAPSPRPAGVAVAGGGAGAATRRSPLLAISAPALLRRAPLARRVAPRAPRRQRRRWSIDSTPRGSGSRAVSASASCWPWSPAPVLGTPLAPAARGGLLRDSSTSRGSSTLRTFRRLDVVTLREWAERSRSSYESQARSILDTWSLEGGEPIFVYPADCSATSASLERLVLGEGDGLVSILALAALYWALCWAFARLWAAARGARARGRSSSAAVAILMLALASTPPVVFFVQVSLSEHPTWIFLLLLFPMLFVSRSPRPVAARARCWQASRLLTRSEPGSRRARGHSASSPGAPGGSGRAPRWAPSPSCRADPLAARLVHNLYYGGQVALTGESQTAPLNTVIPPRDAGPGSSATPAVLKRGAATSWTTSSTCNRRPGPAAAWRRSVSRAAIRGTPDPLWLATVRLSTLGRRDFAPGRRRLLLVGLPLALPRASTSSTSWTTTTPATSSPATSRWDSSR